MKAGRTFRRPKHLLYITAVSNNTRPAMSKMSSDLGFFCDVNQNLKAQRFLSGPLRKQKFTSTGSKGHGLRFVCFCVSRFVAFELQSSRYVLTLQFFYLLTETWKA